MNNQIKQAKINWLIPAKGSFSEGIDKREILVTKDFILNKATGAKTFFKKGSGSEGVQFDDFKVKFDGRVLDVLRENRNVMLAKFKTANLSINLYANNNGVDEMVPYVTVTTQSKRNEYFLLVSNNNAKYDDVFERKGRFVGYLGYNIMGCKLVTIGRLASGSSIPLYIKNGDVTFTNEDELSTSEKTVFDVKNLMLYNKDKSERVLYKRLFTCEAADYKIDVKFMKVLLPSEIQFDVYGKFVDERGCLRVDALKDVKNSDLESDSAGKPTYVSSKYLYQFNVLYTDKETGDHRGIGYTYFPISI
jgi:hypothetical protein